MGIFSTLCGVALRHTAEITAKSLGSSAVGSVFDAVSQTLTERFTDHTQHLTKALQSANQQAWRALEIALAGDGFWDRFRVVVARKEDKVFRDQVQTFLSTYTFPESADTLRRNALIDLRKASKQGLLSGDTTSEELAQKAGAFAQFDDPQRLVNAEWQAVGEIGSELSQRGFRSLGEFVSLRPENGTSLLVVAVRYFLQRATEKDEKLRWMLASAKWEQIASNQQQGFQGIAEVLENHHEAILTILDGLQEAVLETRDVVVEVRSDVKELSSHVINLIENLPKAFSAEGAVSAQLNPETAHLLELLPDGGFRPWELKGNYSSIGRREDSKIRLDDPRVSDKHVALIQLGSSWVAINYSKSKRMRVGGWELRQKTLVSGDVIHIGETRLVYIPATHAKAAESLKSFAGQIRQTRNMRGTLGSLEDEEVPTFCMLTRNNQLIGSSTGSPLLIGSHPSCAVVLPGRTVAAVHALLSWQRDGLHLVDLGSGRGTRYAGRPILDTPVQNGQEIGIGEHTLKLKIEGDPSGPAVALLKRRRETPVSVALTCFRGPHLGESAILPTGRSLVIGSDPSADISLPKDSCIKPRHLEILVNPESNPNGVPDPQIGLRHLTETPELLIKGDGNTAIAGYAMQFGRPEKRSQTALIFHLDLTLDAWC